MLGIWQEWRRGSVTVFLCIVLAAVIPLCGILIDLVRYSEAKKIAESSLKVCAESMLAAYDTQLREQFGLFAMYPREDSGSVEREIYELLSDNLTPENSEGKVTDLYGFKVNRVEVIPVYNYSEPYVMEQQITEFMKYRAPVQVIGEFLEKLKAMTGLMKEGDMIGKSMNLDRMLNGLRENMIYLSLLLVGKMKNINDFGGGEAESKYAMLAIEKNSEIEMSSTPADTSIDDINKFHSEYVSSIPALEQAQADAEPKARAMSSIKSQMDSVKSLINDETAKLESENKKENPDTVSIDASIESLQARLASLEAEYASASAEYSEAENKVNEAKRITDTAQSNMNNVLGSVSMCYETMYKATQETVSLLESLTFELELHIKYCSKSTELANAIIPEANRIQSEKDSLAADVGENPDSAVSGQIGADLEKKLLSVDVGKLNDIINQMDRNRKQLEAWLQEVTTAKNAYAEASMNLETEIGMLGKLTANPADSSINISKFTGYDGNDAARKTLSEKLANYDTFPQMVKNKVYGIPDYVLDPLPTDKERKGFEVWYQNTFHDANLKPEQEKENDDLEKAKGSLGGTTKEIATQEVEVEGNTNLNDLMNLLGIDGLFLPSKGGSSSSDDNLAIISGEVSDTQREQTVNPLEALPQGYGDKVDEKQKNFFDYELERMRKLLVAIVNLLGNTGESLVKSLYMNEYVVSAFKNYTTRDNKLEYDIGWNRPLDKTFFKQGEAEYVVFGNLTEKENLSASKRSIFAIRLIFNLIHVYTDPEKMSTALSVATSIAGWTIFGVPIVQNLLLIGWAAAESWIDAGLLMEGKQVPLVKTRQSWFLSWETLKNYLFNQLTIKATDYLQDKAEGLIDEGASYVEETVSSFIDSKIDMAFSGIEQEWQAVSSDVSQEARNAVNSVAIPDFSKFQSDTLGNFLESVREYIAEQVGSFCTQISQKGTDFIAQCKAALKEKIRSFIFDSSIYKKLKNDIKQYADDFIKKGIGAASDKLKTVLGTAGNGSSSGNNIMGRLIMMDYTDYLRLMLLAVPPETKALRVSDLMQMDMYEASPDGSKPMRQYNTTLYVKAYIDINTLFIPQSLIKKQNDGMIVVEWSLGY